MSIKLPTDAALLTLLLTLTNIRSLSPEDAASVQRFQALKMVSVSKDGWVQYTQGGLTYLAMSGIISVPAEQAPASTPATPTPASGEKGKG